MNSQKISRTYRHVFVLIHSRHLLAASNDEWGMDPDHVVIGTLNKSCFERPLQEYLSLSG
jgi:hypothetical protein